MVAQAAVVFCPVGRAFLALALKGPLLIGSLVGASPGRTRSVMLSRLERYVPGLSPPFLIFCYKQKSGAAASGAKIVENLLTASGVPRSLPRGQNFPPPGTLTPFAV